MDVHVFTPAVQDDDPALAVARAVSPPPGPTGSGETQWRPYQAMITSLVRPLDRRTAAKDAIMLSPASSINKKTRPAKRKDPPQVTDLLMGSRQERWIDDEQPIDCRTKEQAIKAMRGLWQICL